MSKLYNYNGFGFFKLPHRQNGKMKARYMKAINRSLGIDKLNYELSHCNRCCQCCEHMYYENEDEDCSRTLCAVAPYELYVEEDECCEKFRPAVCGICAR